MRASFRGRAKWLPRLVGTYQEESTEGKLRMWEAIMDRTLEQSRHLLPIGPGFVLAMHHARLQGSLAFGS